MVLNLGSSTNYVRPEVCYANLQPVVEVLNKYSTLLTINFDISDYLQHLGWFLFTEEEEDFSKSVCRTMLQKHIREDWLIYQIEHEILVEATPILDALMLEYDRLKALFPDKLVSARGIIISEFIFLICLDWIDDMSPFTIKLQTELRKSQKNNILDDCSEFDSDRYI